LKQIEASGSAWFIINGAADTRERTAERVLSSWTNDLQNAARSETRGGTVLKELQFGNVGVFLVGFVTIRD
jgi:hypothetical protein